MTNTSLSSALAHVADVLDSSEYAQEEVLILIPEIHLANQEAITKYLRDFETLAALSRATEPGTQIFCVFRQRHAKAEDSLWVLERFDSQTALEVHRSSTAVTDMLKWLQESQSNNVHPLPVPLPLQTAPYSFVRSCPGGDRVRERPFVTVTHIDCSAEQHSAVEERLKDFGESLRQDDDLLLYLPGKSNGAWWVVTAYRSEDVFETKGLIKNALGGLIEESGCTCDETLLEFMVGFF